MADQKTPTDGPGAPASLRNRKRDSAFVLTGAVAILLIWFAVANLQKVSIHFWVSTARAPLIVVIALSAALGAVFGYLVKRRKKPSVE